MTNLRTAAQQALEALQEYQSNGAPFLACDGAVAALRAALAHQDEPVEPVAWYQKRGQEVLTSHPACWGREDEPWTPLYTAPPRCPNCSSLEAQNTELDRKLAELDQDEPVQEPVAWMTPGQDLHLNNGEGFRFSDWTPLYPAPPQRKPLAEWQINDLMAGIDPEDVCSWSFRQGVYAAEKHHGVKP